MIWFGYRFPFSTGLRHRCQASLKLGARKQAVRQQTPAGVPSPHLMWDGLESLDERLQTMPFGSGKRKQSNRPGMTGVALRRPVDVVRCQAGLRLSELH